MDELRVALELATDEELQDLTEILFRRKFNPLDYIQGVDPVQVPKQTRTQWLDALEERFRFLAADGFTVLRGDSHTVTYRQVLVRVCRHLKIRFLPSLSTTDLEAEIFLNLLERAWENLPDQEQQVTLERIRTALQTDPSNPLPLHCNTDSFRLLVEGSSALAVTSVLRPLILQKIAQQFAVNVASGSLLLQMAREGAASAALRLATTRSLFATVSGALWLGFAVDLGWRTIATNYGRIIPIIFTLAQIRLTRAEWAYA